MENLRPAAKGKDAEYYKHEPLGKFETEEVRELRPADVGNMDRAFIYTKSGNRYMIRHSESRGGNLVIYNERDSAFASAGAHPFFIRGNMIAEVGFPLSVLAEVEKGSSRNEWKSTQITRIEIRRGVEAAIRNAVKGQTTGGLGAALAETIKDQSESGT
jgi:hypothetical protein